MTSGIIYTRSGDQNALTALISGICQDSTLKGFKKSDFRAHTCDFECVKNFLNELGGANMCLEACLRS